MSEKQPNPKSGAQGRRTMRILQAIPIVVTGQNIEGLAFQERTSTIVLNCHGCRYSSRHEARVGGWVTLLIPNQSGEDVPTRVRAQVKDVIRSKSAREMFQIAVELETPGNVWGIAFPPADWQEFAKAGGKAEAISTEAPAAVKVETPPAVVKEEKIHLIPPAPVAPVAPPAWAQGGSPGGEAAAHPGKQAEAALLAMQGKLDMAASRAVELACNSYVSLAIRRAIQTIEDERGKSAREMKADWAAERDKFRAEVSGIAEGLKQTAAGMRASLEEATGTWKGQNESLNKLFADARAAVEQATAAAGRAAEQAEKLAAMPAPVAPAAAAVETVASQSPAAGVPLEGISDAARAAVARHIEELDQKCTDLAHTTFESLSKAATWYEKKAHAGMESATERSIEQSAAALKEKAAEVSRLFASEIDHQSRSYAEHTAKLMDEASSELLRSVPGKMEESAAQAAAQFQAEAGRATEAQLQRLTQQVAATVDVALLRLREHAQTVRGEVEAVTREALDTSLGAVKEACAAEAESLRAQWQQKSAEMGNEAAEKYRERLENLSNSWMVAAVTSVNQHTKQALDALAEEAEVRLRETWTRVFEGLASAMRPPGQKGLNVPEMKTPGSETEKP